MALLAHDGNDDFTRSAAARAQPIWEARFDAEPPSGVRLLAAKSEPRKIGRPSKATPFAARIASWLGTDPELTTQELLRRAQAAGYNGHKSAFYELVASVRPPRATPVVCFKSLPGQISEHDFGHVDVRVDGCSKRLHLFVSRLQYSRALVVTLVENESLETIVRCLARDFVHFGGLPMLAVFDRPKTIAEKGSGRDAEGWKRTFAKAVLEIGVGVELCAPRSGPRKGSEERLLRWVKGAFFDGREFHNEGDLREQLSAWLVTVNTTPLSQTSGVTPESKHQKEELGRLRPIKVTPEEIALRVATIVGPTAEVHFEGQSYAMPPESALVAGKIYVFEHRLRIVAGGYEMVHRRRKAGEPRQPMPEKRAEELAAVHGERAAIAHMNQRLLGLGSEALELLSEITHREPRLVRQRLAELCTLLESHGAPVLSSAIAGAVRSGKLTVAAVARSRSIVSS